MEHLGPQGGQLQHLVVGDLVQLMGGGHQAGVGRVHAVHVGVNLAQIGVEGGGDGHRRRVRPAPAQGGDVVVLVQPLETGDDDNAPLVQLCSDALPLHPLDAGVAVAGVGAEARLPARERHHREAHAFNGHGAQRTGNLLASGQQHIQLPFGGGGVNLSGLFNEVVRGVPLGGQHRHHPVPFLISIGDNAGHVADLVRVRDGGPAEFLYNQCHSSSSSHGVSMPFGSAGPRARHSILCRRAADGLTKMPGGLPASPRFLNPALSAYWPFPAPPIFPPAAFG